MLSPEARAAAHRLIAILVALIEGIAAPAPGERRPFLTRLTLRLFRISLQRMADHLAALADAAPTDATPADAAPTDAAPSGAASDASTPASIEAQPIPAPPAASIPRSVRGASRRPKHPVSPILCRLAAALTTPPAKFGFPRAASHHA